MTDNIERSGVPWGWLNYRREVNAVYPDKLAAGRRAAEHLLSLGHARIAFVDTSHRPSDVESHYSSHDRYEGYAAAMTEAGLTPRRLWHEDRDDSELRVRFLRSAFAADDRPTAVITLGVSNVTPVFLAATRAGLAVPEDLSVICLDSKVPDNYGLRVATMLIPQHAIGGEAVAMLEQMIRCPGTARPARVVHFDFDPADTCRPPEVR